MTGDRILLSMAQAGVVLGLDRSSVAKLASIGWLGPIHATSRGRFLERTFVDDLNGRVDMVKPPHPGA